MLRSTRLVTNILLIAVLSLSAPAAMASPDLSLGLELDLRARIEAFFSSLENVFHAWAGTAEPSLEARAEKSGGYYDPNGLTGEEEEGDPASEEEDIVGQYDPNGIVGQYDPNGIVGQYDPNG